MADGEIVIWFPLHVARRRQPSAGDTCRAPSFDPAGERIVGSLVKYADLPMVEAGLVHFEYQAPLLRTGHVFNGEAQGLSNGFETSVARATASPNCLAGVKPSSARIVEFGQAMVLRLPERDRPSGDGEGKAISTIAAVRLSRPAGRSVP